MKWKEIFDYLEATVDSIEDVSTSFRASC